MVINLKDLSKKVLLQWRLILVGVLVMAIASTLLGAVFSKRQADEIAAERKEQISLGVPEEELPVVPKVTLISPKMLVLGTVLGFLAAAGVVSGDYVLTGKLRGETDLTDGYSLPVLGTVSFSPKKRRFDCVDRFIKTLYRQKNLPRETVVQLIATDIVMTAEKKGITSLYFTGNAFGSFADELSEALKGSGLMISIGEKAIYSPDLLREMLGSGGVVLLERVEYSAFSDIARELSYCERYSIPVLGAVVID
jgi:hypothetical protein